MNIFKKIIRLNRDLSDAFEKRFLSFKCPDKTRPAFRDTVEGYISSKIEKKEKFKLLEVGSVDRPFLEKSDCFEYHGLDVEPISGSGKIYDKFLVQSIEEKLNEKYNIIISRMVIEHVPNNSRTWKEIYNALEMEGFTVHIFPGSRHPFSIATQIVGNRIQRILIRYLRPNSKHTGYPAYYHLCTPRKLRKELSRIGFQDIRIQYSYSANDYFKFFFPAFLAIATFNLIMTRLGVSEFASNLYVEAKKRDTTSR